MGGQQPNKLCRSATNSNINRKQGKHTDSMKQAQKPQGTKQSHDT
jgi:hypothetical protein